MADWDHLAVRAAATPGLALRAPAAGSLQRYAAGLSGHTLAALGVPPLPLALSSLELAADTSGCGLEATLLFRERPPTHDTGEDMMLSYSLRKYAGLGSFLLPPKHGNSRVTAPKAAFC